jgi:hypothetical protein
MTTHPIDHDPDWPSLGDAAKAAQTLRAYLARPHVTDAEVAELFHQAYEALAPLHGYETREASAVPWADVPEANRRLMIATVGRVRSELRARGAHL